MISIATVSPVTAGHLRSWSSASNDGDRPAQALAACFKHHEAATTCSVGLFRAVIACPRSARRIAHRCTESPLRTLRQPKSP